MNKKTIIAILLALVASGGAGAKSIYLRFSIRRNLAVLSGQIIGETTSR